MNTRQDAAIDSFDSPRQLVEPERDVSALSVVMPAFSPSFQMTGRYVPEYLRMFGAGATVVGLHESVGSLIGALCPYPGGALSGRPGSRFSLTLSGILSSAGLFFWSVTLQVPEVMLAGVSLELWFWIFVGLFLAQAWKSFGLGATFAIVKQNVPPE